MGLRFYNTLSHRVEEFQPRQAGQVALYTCGPTVYDFAHIGNFRSYVFEDLVKRFLIFLGYKVRHVMNLTDIDDKTIRKARERNVPLRQVTDEYSAAFFEDIDILRLRRADVYPRATEHIAEMLTLIQQLLAGGHAYQQDGSVYFSIASFPDYGRLANIEKEHLRRGVRSDADEYDKLSVQDFVLWKAKKEGEPSWPAPFGEGRPGWHIECSAMSMKYLGAHFDIHMGGVDNIFPHHENEIAQSECANKEKFVNYWIHAQHLIVDNQKMSKSLGNFYTLRDLLQKGYSPLVIRYLLLATHYRKLLNFTFDGLESARQALSRIQNFLLSLRELKCPAGDSAEVSQAVTGNLDQFSSHLADDFNISGALGSLFDFIHWVNLRLNELQQGDVQCILAHMQNLDQVLGVLESGPQAALEEEIREKIRQREEARRQKNYQLADEIRQQLRQSGIVLQDTADGVKWHRQFR